MYSGKLNLMSGSNFGAKVAHCSVQINTAWVESSQGVQISPGAPSYKKASYGCSVNVMDAFMPSCTVTVHDGSIPTHEPPHSTIACSGSGVAVNVTLVDAGNVAVHCPGQSTPAGELLTVPPPIASTLRVTSGSAEKALVDAIAMIPMASVWNIFMNGLLVNSFL